MWTTRSKTSPVAQCVSLLYLWLGLLLTSNMAPVHAADPLHPPGIRGSDAIAVLYPEIAEPYRSILTRIIEGIEGQLKARVRVYPLGSSVDVPDLDLRLKRDGVKVVIALGRQGLKTASGLNRDITVVAGAVLAVPEGGGRVWTGISLMPDPALLFARLKSLLPAAKKIVVVYDPRHNDWLIRLAREAAKAQNLELVAYQAHDLAEAARRYEQILASLDGRSDALWLPQDVT